VPAIKIASAELTNLPLLEATAQTGRPVILSTGMATWDEIAVAVREFHLRGNYEVALLQCTVRYPAPMKQANLIAMLEMENRFARVAVGYSDHTLGITAPIAAAALGARIIEKHFTIDSSLKDRITTTH
jgi:pseudaminic acid synthase